MAKFDAINVLNTLLAGFLVANVSNLAVIPDLWQSIRNDGASTVQILYTGEDFVPLGSNGTYRDERYNVRAKLLTNSRDDNTQQVFRDTLKEIERLFTANQISSARTEEYELEYENIIDKANVDVLFIVTRKAVPI